MSNVEAMLGASSDDADDGDLELGRLIERSSFGWPQEGIEKALPSPKAAAAAVGAAVAVVAAGPAAAVAAV